MRATQVQSESAPDSSWAWDNNSHDLATDRHRHPERRCLVEAHAHVLESEAGRKAEIEAARQHVFRELVGGGRVAPARDVDDVEHQLRIEAGLDAEDERLGRDRNGRLRHQVVGELERLPKPGFLADVEHPAEQLEQGLDRFERRARTRRHDREFPGARTGDAAADRRIERLDAALAQALVDRDRGGRTGGRQVDEDAHRGAVAHAVRAAHDVEHAPRASAGSRTRSGAADATAAGESAPRRAGGPTRRATAASSRS